MTRKVKMRIGRGDSKNGDFKDVTVEANEGEVVLDVIHRDRKSTRLNSSHDS